jgi:hypothetical protein
MTEEITIYVDYIGNKKYGVFIDDPCKEKPDFVVNSVSASFTFISNNYGIDANVEISHCAEIIFKLENDLNMEDPLS